MLIGKNDNDQMLGLTGIRDFIMGRSNMGSDKFAGDGNGSELIKRLKAHRPGTKIPVCSMHDEALFAQRALNAGAMGYINK